MKKNIKIITLITLIITFYSCNQFDTVETFDNPNSGWIEMLGYDNDADEDTANVFERTANFDEGEIEIPIKLTTATNLNGINVTYNVSLESGSVDQSILGDKNFMIDKYSDIGNILFTPIYSDSFYTLKFTLNSTDDGNFQVGLSDGSKPIEFVLHVTNFKAYDAAPAAFGDQALTYVAMVGRPDATHFVVDSLWGPNFVAWATGNDDYLGLYLNEGTLTINSDDNSLTVTGDYVADDGSSGTYDTTTGILTFSFTQANLFGSGFQVDNVLTPQP